MKVYVIEHGYYSDRYIIGVTESRKDAEEIVRAMNLDEDATDITEYDTEQFKVNNRLRFFVELGFYGDDECSFEDDSSCYSKILKTTRLYDSAYIVYAKNHEEALKIARDMEAQRKYQKQIGFDF